METITLGGLIDIFGSFGTFGVVVLIWYLDSKAIRKTQQQYKDDMLKVLRQYKDDMADARRRYENNVKLVEAYQDVARDLKDLIIMSTQHLTRLSDQISQNQYCPMQRIEKKTVEVPQ